MTHPASPSPDPTLQLRRSVYALLIWIAFGMMTGRVISIEGFNGDNDRSRWATIRALVDHQSYAIGIREYLDEEGKSFRDKHYQDQTWEPRWDSIDKVLKPDIAWRNPTPKPREPLYAKNFFSSKPPLLPTILAGEYWLLRNLFGWTMGGDERLIIVRIILWTTNVLPWVIALWLMALLIDRLGVTDLGRIAAVAAAAFCTFASTFAITLNNHCIAWWAVVFSLYPSVKAALEKESLGWDGAFLSGFWAAWASVNELPAASFAGLLFLWVLISRPPAVLPFLLGAALPLAGFLITNYLAIGTALPAYEKFGTEWYNYPGSHWLNPQGIDAANDSLTVYFFHLTFGHHGWFSLTPILFLSLFALLHPRMGLVVEPHVSKVRCILSWGTLLISLVVLGFYLSKTDSYNYGGWTSGPRWLFWLAPLWLLSSLPVLDALAPKRWGRVIIGIALALSAISVYYPTVNPWRHPWLLRLFEYLGWIRY